MISVKQGVRLEEISGIIIGFMVVASVLHSYGYGTIITAGIDGDHMKTGLHYKGLALDLRSKHIESLEQKQEILGVCKQALQSNYDFFIENLGQDDEHFHLEFQPKD